MAGGLILGPRTEPVLLFYFRSAEEGGEPERVQREFELLEPGAAEALHFLHAREAWEDAVIEKIRAARAAGLEPTLADVQDMLEEGQDRLLAMVLTRPLDGLGPIPVEDLQLIPVATRCAILGRVESWLMLEAWLRSPFQVLERSRGPGSSPGEPGSI